MWGSPVSSDVAYLREAELALLNAPFVEQGWEGALADMARATHCRGANMVCLGGSVPSLNLLVGYDTDAAYEREFSRPELWGAANWRVSTTLDVGTIQHDGHYAHYRQQAKTEVYDDAASDFDMQFGCQALYYQAEGGVMGVAMLRDRRDGECTEETLRRFARLSRAATRAIRAEVALAGEGVNIVLGQIEEVEPPLFLLNRHGWLCGASASAERLLAAGDIVDRRRGRLVLRDALLDRRIRELSDFYLDGDSASRAAISVPGRFDGPVESVYLAPLPTTGGALGFGPRLAIRFDLRA